MNVAGARFYLNPIVNWTPERTIWFSRNPVGRNKLGQFAKDAARKGGLELEKKQLFVFDVAYIIEILSYSVE